MTTLFKNKSYLVALMLGFLASALIISCRSTEDKHAPETLAPSIKKNASPPSSNLEKPITPRSSPSSAPVQSRTNSAQVVLLGTGTPIPDPDRSGPATAVVAGNKAYLVDFGPGVVRRASAAFLKGIAQLNTRLLSRAFVTHLHSDHTAGFSDLILSPAVIGRPVPLEVYGPPGIKAMTKHILDAYREDLEVRRIKHTQRGIRGYQVHAHEISAGAIYKDKNVKVTAFPVRHGFWKHAFGYRFDTENRSIVISGDTGPAETTIAACNGCDVLVHEVYCLRGFENGSSSWQEYHATHHTSSKELAELASRARPGLLVLYHQLFFGCAERQIMDEIRSRYKGEVVFGNDLDVY